LLTHPTINYVTPFYNPGFCILLLLFWRRLLLSSAAAAAIAVLPSFLTFLCYRSLLLLVPLSPAQSASSAILLFFCLLLSSSAATIADLPSFLTFL
jgi:hypothetical protein